MKIQMIGHSRAGKTTYMAAMYKVMAEDGGYQLRLSNKSDHAQLTGLGNNLKYGIYPAETAVKSQYNFRFYYEDENLFSFEWMDYRGGVLDLVGVYDDIQILEEVDKCANNCESMIAFVDSTTLNTKTGLEQWENLKDFILKFAGRATENNPLNLAIIVTKTDICQRNCDFTDTLVGKELIKTINQIQYNKHLYGMLAFSEINRESFGNTFFSVLHVMSVPLLKSIHKEMKRFENEMEYFKSLNPNLWNDFTSWLNGTYSERQKAQETYESMEKHYQKLETLNAHIHNVDEILRKYADDNNYILF